jgi:outer membrane protein assembly factor BamB
MRVSHPFLLALAGLWLLAAPAVLLVAADWPLWRYDAQRSAVTPERLPETLRLAWSRRLPAPAPAWDDAQLGFDLVDTPVIVGNRLFVGSSRNGCLVALDAVTGEELWRFWTDGPVRLPPAAHGAHVFVASDDGYLYGVDQATGKEVWRFFAGLSSQALLANSRIASMWAVRGGPVLANGRLYFAAGVWPFMGVSIYALDPESGRTVWVNDSAGVFGTNQGYDQYKQYWGVSPQGALAVCGETLVVPSCRAQPLLLDAGSGALQRAEAGWKSYGGGGDSRLAVAAAYLFVGGFIFDREKMLPICLNAADSMLNPLPVLPLLDGNRLGVATAKTLELYDLTEAKRQVYTGSYGVRLVRTDAASLWRVALASPPTAMIKAGDRFYLGGVGKLLALAANPAPGVAPAPLWQQDLEGTPLELAAANGRLFVTTREGRLYCFAADATDAPPPDWPRPETALVPAPRWEAAARQLLDQTGVTSGYAVILGLADGGLVTEWLRTTQLEVIALDANPETVRALRERLAAAGLLGPRAAVLQCDPFGAALPPYLASLIASERPDLIAATPAARLARAVFPTLRPYGGVAHLPLAESLRTALEREVQALCPGEARFQTMGEATVITRPAALPEASDWTHDAADPGNTWMSRDALVKAPLGVLWFGGPTEKSDLYRGRHSDPPTARFADGRLFIYGNGTVSAVDAYTGRILWQRGMPKTRPFQNARAFARGGEFPDCNGGTSATAWYVALADSLYLAYGQVCEVWDPATGKTLREFRLPPDGGAGDDLFWGDLRVEGEVLIAGAQFPEEDQMSVFGPDDLADASPADLPPLLSSLREWAPLRDETALTSAAAAAGGAAVLALNRLLGEPALDTIMPAQFVAAVSVADDRGKAIASALAALKKHRERQAYAYTPYLSTASLNRGLLEACYPQVRRRAPVLYWHNLYPWDGTYTRQLVGLQRHTGALLWRQRAQDSFPQKSIAAGKGRVFCIDRLDADLEAHLARRSAPPARCAAIKAFDLTSGQALWSVEGDIPGYHLMYSAENDILVAPSAHDPDPAAWSRKSRQQWVRLTAYRGADGTVLWDKKLELDRTSGRHRMWYNWLLCKDRVVVESYYDTHADFYGFDLRTGESQTRQSPLTDVEIPWSAQRRGGCTKNLSCPNLLLFRSSTAGYYDTANDGGTVNLTGFRTGCKNSLIPAGGIVNAPNYASGCTCNYPVFTALALRHMPEVETWSTSNYTYDGAAVTRLGLNLGAPGDRRAPDGTFWLDYPSVGGPSPDLPVQIEPTSPEWFYRHSARIRGGPLPWVTASGAEGLTSLKLTLRSAAKGAGSPPTARLYTVRLFFAENTAAAPGARVFAVALQGKTVIEALDLAHEVGRDLGLVKEFHGVEADTTLTVSLVPKTGKTLLCGIELRCD